MHWGELSYLHDKNSGALLDTYAPDTKEANPGSTCSQAAFRAIS